MAPKESRCVSCLWAALGPVMLVAAALAVLYVIMPGGVGTPEPPRTVQRDGEIVKDVPKASGGTGRPKSRSPRKLADGTGTTEAPRVARKRPTDEPDGAEAAVTPPPSTATPQASVGAAPVATTGTTASAQPTAAATTVEASTPATSGDAATTTASAATVSTTTVAAADASTTAAATTTAATTAEATQAASAADTPAGKKKPNLVEGEE